MTGTKKTSNKPNRIFLYGFALLSFLFVWIPIIIPLQPSIKSSFQSSTIQNNENYQISYVKQNNFSEGFNFSYHQPLDQNKI
jgi:hypothetical protein